MYKLTCAYDESTSHWSKEYESEFEAWKDFFSFTDWGFANEYMTLNIYTPALKCYTKIFYREGRKVVTK